MAALFFLALLFAAWAPRIPQVKEDLGLSDGELGLALLGAPLGAVATLWVTGLLVGRLGSVPLIRMSLVGYALGGVGVVIASGMPSLFAALLLWGGVSCALDVSANAQAVAVERRFGRQIMTTVHAAWTAGALVGAGLGAGAAAIDLSLGIQLSVLGAITIAGSLPLTAWMLRGDAARDRNGERDGERDVNVDADAETAGAPDPLRDPVSGRVPVSGRELGPDGRASTRLTPRRVLPFVPLSAISFASYLGEGIAADWSAVYLTDVTGASPGVAGVGFVAYMACMLGVRVVGDRVVAAYGALRTVRPLALGAGAVFAVAVAFGNTAAGTVMGIVGFAVLGAGLACVVPSAFSAAGRVGSQVGVSAGTAIAVVSSVGYAGWLAGPPLIGGVAELVGLHAAMWTVVALTGVIAVLTGALTAHAGRRG